MSSKSFRRRVRRFSFCTRPAWLDLMLSAVSERICWRRSVRSRLIRVAPQSAHTPPRDQNCLCRWCSSRAKRCCAGTLAQASAGGVMLLHALMNAVYSCWRCLDRQSKAATLKVGDRWWGGAQVEMGNGAMRAAPRRMGCLANQFGWHCASCHFSECPSRSSTRSQAACSSRGSRSRAGLKPRVIHKVCQVRVASGWQSHSKLRTPARKEEILCPSST